MGKSIPSSSVNVLIRSAEPLSSTLTPTTRKPWSAYAL